MRTFYKLLKLLRVTTSCIPYKVLKISLYPSERKIFQDSTFFSTFFKVLANQRQDKYSLAHAHSTDAHIHTYGQYMMCAVHSVLCICK